MILDSVSTDGVRLSSLHLRYWRPIHSELMTHRVFSRNARSSRAVPVLTLLSEDIFVPQFGMNQPGMQAKDEAVDPDLLLRWEDDWRELAEITRSFVRKWGEDKMHKQWANRPLEWFGWIDVLVTSTDWANFWALRISEYAQPELRLLAEEMKRVMDASTPRLIQPGQYHMPFVSDELIEQSGIGTALKVSTARCARISYKTFDGSDPTDLDREIERYNQLVVSRPVHASPSEHQATPDYFMSAGRGGFWQRPHLHGNFNGWIQHRKMIPDESVQD